MTKDPVCGMELMEEKAPFKTAYKDTTYYFCGNGCKERFEHDPEKYLSGRPVDWVRDEEK